MSWNDANECCQWLSDKDEKLTFVLPTEAQWEYACRAGTQTAWYCGDDIASLEKYAWYTCNKVWWPRGVSQKLPNAFGLCDMHGNVWEWCWDSFHSYMKAGYVDPVAPDDGEYRITRGGNCFYGFHFNDWNVFSCGRSAVRLVQKKDRGMMDRGFRVAAYFPEAVLQAKKSGN